MNLDHVEVWTNLKKDQFLKKLKHLFEVAGAVNSGKGEVVGVFIAWVGLKFSPPLFPSIGFDKFDESEYQHLLWWSLTHEGQIIGWDRISKCAQDVNNPNLHVVSLIAAFQQDVGES